MRSKCHAGAMIQRIWAGTSAAIGAAIVVMLVIHGTALGTWVDEAGISDPTMPSMLLPIAVTFLGAVLLVGGVIALMSEGWSSRLENRPSR